MIINGSTDVRKPKENQEKLKSNIGKIRKAKESNKKCWTFLQSTRKTYYII